VPKPVPKLNGSNELERATTILGVPDAIVTAIFPSELRPAGKRNPGGPMNATSTSVAFDTWGWSGANPALSGTNEPQLTVPPTADRIT